MKIIGINSSPHRNGSTSGLLREVLNGAKESGAETEEIYLPDHEIKYCLGCQQCLTKEGCVINDDLNGLREKILQADGVVLASPTYEMDMNGMMKNFLDRIMPYTGYRSALRNKYIAAVSTAGAFGAQEAARRMTVIKMGFHQQGKVSGSLGAHVGWGDISSYLAKAKTLGRKMVDDIRNRRPYRLQSLGQKLVFGMFVRPKMEKMIVANKDGLRKGVYDYLKREGLIR